MSDIDEILEEVEDSLMARKTTGRETILASEVRRLRAENAEMRGKLVQAAKEIVNFSGMISGLSFEVRAEYARGITGIRLKFDGEFLEDKS